MGNILSHVLSQRNGPTMDSKRDKKESHYIKPSEKKPRVDNEEKQAPQQHFIPQSYETSSSIASVYVEWIDVLQLTADENNIAGDLDDSINGNLDNYNTREIEMNILSLREDSFQIYSARKGMPEIGMDRQS